MPRRCAWAFRIVRHDTSDVVQLSDGSRWRIWPADVATTLQWFPTTELEIERFQDEFCSHVLVNHADGSRVRVIDERLSWPSGEVQRSLGLTKRRRN
jgi:hypothetical protein